MNEALPETIAYRAAEAEMRRLCNLRDSAAEELQAIRSQVETAKLDSAAFVAHALAGDEVGAAAVMQAATPAGRVEYLQTLIGALFGQIETKGFELQRLMQAAYVADEPRVVAFRKAQGEERMRLALGNFATHPDPPIDHSARLSEWIPL